MKKKLKKTMKFFLNQPEIGITLHKRKVKKEKCRDQFKNKNIEG